MKYTKNCRFCVHLGEDDSGGDYELHSFPICEKNYQKSNLKSFPFQKPQPCHVPDFWKVLEVDHELMMLYRKDTQNDSFPTLVNTQSYKKFVEKYGGQND